LTPFWEADHEHAHERRLIVSVKRLNYFNHQFLAEQDFKDEQAYHIKMRRLHNRLFHSWGVVEGLEVRRKEDREITVEPGTAIDKEGREILLSAPARHDLVPFRDTSHVYVTIAYKELKEDADFRSTGGVEDYHRITESPEISVRKDQPPSGEPAVALARVHLDEHGFIHHIDMGDSVRRFAGRPSAAAAGWVRLPFKPVSLELVRIDKKLVQDRGSEADFTIDIASAYCGEKGARGSMQIPVPPGATKVKAFRIAGTTRGSIRVQLVRGGWNVEEGKGEKTVLLGETVTDASFHKHIPVPEESQRLHQESHALAVSVVAEGETEIWLVAAQFE
jgi:hypothetical protein